MHIISAYVYVPVYQPDPRDYYSQIRILHSCCSSGVIRIWVLGSDEDEPEEVFLVRFVAASGGAVFDSSSPARIIISQRGMPYGVVGFAGEALDPRVFLEGREPVDIHFPVSRAGGSLGVIQVSMQCCVCVQWELSNVVTCGTSFSWLD